MGFGRPSDPRGETRGLSEIIHADAGKIKLAGRNHKKIPSFHTGGQRGQWVVGDRDWRCLGRLPAGSPKGWGRALAQLLTGTVRNLPLTLSEHEIIRLILDSENFINLKIWQIGGGAGL